MHSACSSLPRRVRASHCTNCIMPCIAGQVVEVLGAIFIAVSDVLNDRFYTNPAWSR